MNGLSLELLLVSIDIAEAEQVLIAFIVAFPQDASKVLSVFFLCLLYTSPSPRDGLRSRSPSSA